MSTDEKRDTSSADDIVTRLTREDKVPWYKKPNLRILYLLLFPSCIGVEMTSGFDSSMMNGLQAVGNWQDYFGHPQKSLLGLMSAIYSLGAILVLPIVPFINDRTGRRGSIMIGSLVMLLGAALQGASQNIAMFIMSRFILGLGIPLAIIGASSLLGELSHPKERAIMGSLFNACWFIGSIVAAGTTLGTFAIRSTWAWRIPSLLQLVPSILQVIFIYVIPESPRWLISKGRGEEAHAILAKYHAEGDINSEFAKAEYAQIENTIKLELESSNTSWNDIIATSGMRKRILIGSFLGLATQWSGNGLTSYFLAVILDTIGVRSNRTKNIVNLCLTVWGFTNATVFALTVSRFRRRVIYLCCTISMTLCFIGWTVASARYAETKSHSASSAVLAFIFIYSPCYNIAYNALTYTFLIELFPYRVRAKGLSVFQWFSRAAGFFNQFVNPIGVGNAGWKYYLMYIIFLGFEVIFVYFLFPETSNKTLEELTFLYESDIRQEQAKRVEKDLRHLDGDLASETATK